MTRLNNLSHSTPKLGPATASQLLAPCTRHVSRDMQLIAHAAGSRGHGLPARLSRLRLQEASSRKPLAGQPCGTAARKTNAKDPEGSVSCLWPPPRERPKNGRAPFEASLRFWTADGAESFCHRVGTRTSDDNQQIKDHRGIHKICFPRPRRTCLSTSSNPSPTPR
jgi:hypothetical protein